MHFAGFCNQSALPGYYAAADLIVLPSDGSETWGLVVNEAMACGLPAIVSDRVGCAQDLVEEAVTGHTFPLGSVSSLAECLIVLQREIRTRRAEIIQSVQSRVVRYSCAAGVEATLAALDQVCPRRAPTNGTADPRAGAA